ncbi:MULTISPECIES: hypothetical protein [Acidithiobacillus]|jgi:hypothetical protein|nr:MULTISPECIES: hypothetical protein [Acidithiobacillus]MEB8491041.1 hypothetical protein [Acidithiobacillus ferriphilus]MEB8493916.1 hypothetical protein [Acidithiobacillus ferriphilus]MEB8514397.1 hypothetical protein [Acidithiobacillus ferriphilus]MEB8522843.1 hypothetical protein [Acidithiobacillus ferriphilus]MEB8532507.1 hypothetical protein [Acidithiobacillus ferriphilus]
MDTKPEMQLDTPEKPFLLTPSEIDSLRQEMRASSEWAKKELRRRMGKEVQNLEAEMMPSPGGNDRPPLIADRLTNSEIESLRQDAKETHEYCQKRFGDKHGEEGRIVYRVDVLPAGSPTEGVAD